MKIACDISTKPSSWWTEVKKLNGIQTVGRNSQMKKILNVFRPNDHHTESEKIELANEINHTFVPLG